MSATVPDASATGLQRENLPTQPRNRVGGTPPLQWLQDKKDAIAGIDFLAQWKQWPLMAVLAVIITYLGALGYFATAVPHEIAKQAESQDISDVYDVYGPGQFLSWLLAVGSLQYDCYHRSSDRPLVKQGSSRLFRVLDKVKLVGLAIYALFAIGNYVLFTYRMKFGPTHAAARYVGDKVFESGALIFFLVSWKEFADYMRGAPIPMTEQVQSNDFRNQPAFFLALIWGYIRNLEYGLDGYDIPMKHPQFIVDWSVLPRWSGPISWVVGMTVGVALSKGDIRRRVVDGFGKGFYIAFAVLHSGLFGTWGSLRMTDKRLNEPGQYLPLVGTVVTLVYQYWDDLQKLPDIGRQRAKNVWEFWKLAKAEAKEYLDFAGPKI